MVPSQEDSNEQIFTQLLDAHPYTVGASARADIGVSNPPEQRNHDRRGSDPR